MQTVKTELQFMVLAPSVVEKRRCTLGFAGGNHIQEMGAQGRLSGSSDTATRPEGDRNEKDKLGEERGEARRRVFHAVGTEKVGEHGG